MVIDMEPSKLKSTKNHSPKPPLVSIITPTYNHEKFIGTCIESVLGQTYENWEMIIIDDGSIDDTGTVVGKYNDNRIKYVKQENLGIWKLSKTYNKALGMSKGELVAILEGDDAWPSYKLEEQVKIFNKHDDAVLSWGRKNTINDKSEIISFDLLRFQSFMDASQEEIIGKLILFNFMQPCTVMINKDTLLSIGGFLQDKNAPFVDYSTFLELSLKGRFYPSDRVLGCWRKHKAQVTTLKQAEINKVYMLSVDFYEKLNPLLKDSIKFDVADKLKYHEKHLSYEIAASARLSLIKGDWNEALTQYKSIFGKVDFIIKLQAFLGIISALLRIDMEWLAVLACEPKIRDASGEWDTTLFDKYGNLTRLFKIQISTLNFFRRLRGKPVLRVEF